MRGVTVRRAQDQRPRRAGWLRRSVLGVALATLLPLGVSVIESGTAAAAFNPSGMDFWVDSPVMGPIKSRVFRAADGNTDRVVYALDGMRARQDISGWEIETNIADALTKANINVVMPVGGQSSFYADWNSASSFLGLPPISGSSSGSSSGSGAFQVLASGPGKSYRYDWETFLTRDLRNALHDRLGFNPSRNGVFGLSMGGSAALTLAAYHPDQFSYAGSYSGYLNVSAPGMREALRVAMIDAGGYNIDSMAPPWGPKWLYMDPFVFAPRLKANNTRLWISAGSGLPGPTDGPNFNTLNAMGLETLALANTRAFQVRMMTLGAGNVTYDFPNVGVHNWRYWEDEVYRMLPDLSANIG
ncbi:esterase family protein [Nocardia terpenica]|uniref:Mycolyltransferase n=1 Tax=Nocardia terpenica TaxID=455432 RepID=A0A164H7U4_9NOCA|nr:alpha/beta hydrolase family protein [Nocardia terpenica]KZM68276.1 mycolyltransferase [Nocardia terpenica]MBF6065082.1 esterase family protein [Nocardia terpenica]MBF6108139.1 esterase family protein [Nocardia terpenica]MBF6115354.1 esterase family protein [Nocardia terpenica]MBF6122676.1 esterase family protein [Nocardia terpenica]